MKRAEIRILNSFERFICDRENFVFDYLSFYLEPMERFKNRSNVMKFKSFGDSTSSRVKDKLTKIRVCSEAKSWPSGRSHPHIGWCRGWRNGRATTCRRGVWWPLECRPLGGHPCHQPTLLPDECYAVLEAVITGIVETQRRLVELVVARQREINAVDLPQAELLGRSSECFVHTLRERPASCGTIMHRSTSDWSDIVNISNDDKSLFSRFQVTQANGQ